MHLALSFNSITGFKTVRAIENRCSRVRRKENLSFYRTNSHAGLPKGSYSNPNPLHFHIVRYVNIPKNVAPTIIKVTPSMKRESYIFSNKKPIVTVNVGHQKSISVDISLRTLKDFIFPFANALNFSKLTESTSVSSQTSYVKFQRGKRLSSSSNFETYNNYSYTPLNLNTSETKFCENEVYEETDTFENDIMLKLKKNLIYDIINESILYKETSLAETSQEITKKKICFNSDNQALNIDQNNDQNVVFVSEETPGILIPVNITENSFHNNIYTTEYDFESNVNIDLNKNEGVNETFPNEKHDFEFNVETKIDCNLTEITKINNYSTPNINVFTYDIEEVKNTDKLKKIENANEDVIAENNDESFCELKQEDVGSILNKKDFKQDLEELNDSNEFIEKENEFDSIEHIEHKNLKRKCEGKNEKAPFLQNLTEADIEHCKLNFFEVNFANQNENNKSNKVTVNKEENVFLKEINSLKEKYVFTPRSESFDEGIISDCISSLNSSIELQNSSDDSLNEIVNVIVDYLLGQSFEVKELILFPELLYDENINKLLHKLQVLLKDYVPSPTTDEEKNILRINIYLLVMKKLKDEKCPIEGNLSQYYDDKLFSLSEFASDVLDIVFNNCFNFEDSSNNTNFNHSTPLNSAKLNENLEKSLGEKATEIGEVTSFQTKTKKTYDSFWIAINKSPISEKINSSPRKIVNVDEIPLKPPSELSNLTSMSDEPGVSFFKNNDVLSDEEKNCTEENYDDFLAGGDGQNFSMNGKIKRKIVVCNSVSFYRNELTDPTSYIQSTEVEFLRSSIEINEPNNNDIKNDAEKNESESHNTEGIGNWMGYKFAEF